MGLCASEVINPEEVDLSHFQIMTTIGAGGFGKVRLAIDVKEQRINPNKYVAMKFLDISYYYKPHRRAQLRREREALSTIKSDFVVNLMHAFKTSDEIVFVMPFLQGGDFCVYLSRKSLTPEQVKFAAAECILGLEAIHRHSYVYRDLKPENILLDGDGHCVITDLGLVAKISEFDSKYNEPFSKRWDPPHHCRLRGVSGTPGYMAPEVFVKSYDQLADFYALGALIYSLFTNKVPFPNQSRKYFFKTAFVLPEAVNRFSPTAKSFVKGLCAYYEKDRLGYKKFWDDVKSHPFFETEKSFSWSRIEKRQAPSPFKITQDFNFDIRYNLEDTFALNYGIEGDRMNREETKKIFDQLKGISYNNLPPFKLSDGTFYSVGNGFPPPASPHVLPQPAKAPPKSDMKENKMAILRKPKITHMSKISVSHTSSKMSASQRTLHSHIATGDSKRNSPAPSGTISPRTSHFQGKSRRAISTASHPDSSMQTAKEAGLHSSMRRRNKHSHGKSDASSKLVAPIVNPAATPVENPAAAKGVSGGESPATSKPDSS
uniref:Protein kinase domain-containing protein n=1 Tax=Lotharella oceanica TaxID=641309 RepID=A0A7S2U448_9EUKA|mmetsp:Transcript_94/g.219  ORF Transcript_94/g.219 Transcript_94/m.219 type:complete len:545 (+) Transcript_94:88-1722(+)